VTSNEAVPFLGAFKIRKTGGSAKVSFVKTVTVVSALATGKGPSESASGAAKILMAIEVLLEFGQFGAVSVQVKTMVPGFNPVRVCCAWFGFEMGKLLLALQTPVVPAGVLPVSTKTSSKQYVVACVWIEDCGREPEPVKATF
jgi:hypothetical protein